MDLSERIKSFRQKKGYSQEQLARKLHLTQGAVSQWELGITSPSAPQISALADLLGTSADDLLGRTKPEASALTKELDSDLLKILQSLTPYQIQRVMDFIAGMKVTE